MRASVRDVVDNNNNNNKRAQKRELDDGWEIA